MSASVFQGQKKVRSAELIVPPNTLKKKAGSGGLDDSVIDGAEKALVGKAEDFRPLAKKWLAEIEGSLNNAASGAMSGDAAIEALIHPVMQMKSHGAMFGFPQITDISDSMINFLETVTIFDRNLINLIKGYMLAVSGMLDANVLGPDDERGRALKAGLEDAYGRYYRLRDRRAAE